MAERKTTNSSGINTSGFKTPLNVGPASGDAMDAPYADAPAGPVPDPIGNISPLGGPKAPKMLPEN
jgi:hypothetical protein